jgi:hypothetical protein
VNLRRGSVMGGVAVVVVVAAGLLSVASFLAVDSRSHSVSDTLYGWVGWATLIWVPAAGVVLALRRGVGRGRA